MQIENKQDAGEDVVVGDVVTSASSEPILGALQMQLEESRAMCLAMQEEIKRMKSAALPPPNPPTPAPNPPAPAPNPPVSLPPAEILRELPVVASPPLVATSTPLQQIPCVDRHNVFDEYMQQQIMQDRTAREIHSHEQTLRLQIYENLLMRRGR